VKGEIIRGWLGVKIQFVDENIAKGMGLENTRGALVAEIVKGSPADKAGIKIGDIITRFDGKEVPNMHKLPRMVADVPINKKVSVQIFRNGKFEVLHAVIEKPKGELSNEESEAAEDAEESDQPGKIVLGLKVANLDAAMRSKYKLDKNIAGIVITGINRNSPAIELGVLPGDVIQQVNKKKINNVADFESTVSAIKAAGGGNAVILVNRNGENRFLVLEFE
jgi:serine protease Do